MAAIDTYLKEAQAAGERAQSVRAEAMEEAAAEARRIEEEERRLLRSANRSRRNESSGV